MGVATIIMGQSGTGKSASMRNLDPSKVLLIQAVKKPMPFKSAGWKPWDGKEKTGSVAVTDNSVHICKAIERAKANGKSIVVIDDFQYIMANEFMRRANEKGYDKFTQMAKNVWDIFQKVIDTDDDVRVYVLTHTQTDEYGQNAKMKTIGKMLDEKITLEGMVTIVLRSHRQEGQYFLTTQNDGSDTVKSPMGMFADESIDNDLAVIDATICEYYGITETTDGKEEAQ